MGAIRSCSQSISYEISLILLFLGVLFFSSSLVFFRITRVFLFPLFLAFWGSAVAETNRAPFDFREGERELISGFNLEYGASPFVLLFLAEYGMVLFFSCFLRCFFLEFSFLFLFFILFSFIFLRRVFPRFRYDKLI